MAFRDYAQQKVMTSSSSWTKAERRKLPEVLTHIRKNNAVVKWHIDARLKNISFTEYCRGRGDVALPIAEAWVPENMKDISYCAAMQVNGHMFIAFLLHTTWHTMGLTVGEKKVKDEHPDFKPIIDKNIMDTLRKVIPSISSLLKQTTLVEFVVPDVTASHAWLAPYADVYRNNTAPVYDENFYNEHEKQLIEETSDINIVWCGLCPQTTKAALQKITFEEDKLDDEGDYIDRYGSQFVHHTNRARPLVATFLDSEKLNVGAGYSTVLNNCVSFVESLTGIPCNGLGLHVPGLCRFNRKKMPPSFGFLEADVLGARNVARESRSVATRLADWIVSCNVEEITPDIMQRVRTLAAVATYRSRTLLCVGFATTGEGLCSVAWIALYFTSEGFKLAQLPKSTQTVRKHMKIYAITDATDYLIELAFIVESRRSAGVPLKFLNFEMEAKVRAHNELTKEANGLWDELFINKRSRNQKAVDLIEEFDVA